MALGTVKGEAAGIVRWLNPLLAALEGVPDRHCLDALYAAVHEAMHRGALSRSAWERIVKVILEEEGT